MKIEPENLARARLARAMSQEEAAMACDLSARTIQRIEAGHSASLESTKALVSVFGDAVLQTSEDQVLNWTMVRKFVAERFALASRFSASLGLDVLRAAIAVCLAAVALAKPFTPERTGLFVYNDSYAIGMLRHIPSGSHEVLGYWIMPLMIAGAGSALFSIGRFRNLFWNRLRVASSFVRNSVA